MTDILKKLHAELNEFFSTKGTDAPPRKKSKIAEAEEVDEITEDEVPQKRSKLEEDDDEDEAPKKKGRTIVEEDQEEDEIPKKKKGKTTLVQVKSKVRELLESYGRKEEQMTLARKAAVKILKDFDVETVGQLNEDQYDDFIFACQRQLERSNKKKVEVDEDDLD